MKFPSFLTRKGRVNRVKSKDFKSDVENNPYIIREIGENTYLIDPLQYPNVCDDNRFCILCDEDAILVWNERYDDKVRITDETYGECPGSDHASVFYTDYPIEDLTKTMISKLELIDGDTHGRS